MPKDKDTSTLCEVTGLEKPISLTFDGHQFTVKNGDKNQSFSNLGPALRAMQAAMFFSIGGSDLSLLKMRL